MIDLNCNVKTTPSRNIMNTLVSKISLLKTSYRFFGEEDKFKPVLAKISYL